MSPDDTGVDKTPAATDTSHFVVAFCGPPGAGKTTLVRALATTLAAETVFYDDFQDVTSQSTAEMTAWFDRGADPDEFDLSRLVAELTRARRVAAGATRRVVLFETPFGRRHRATGAMIDLLVWCDVPLDIALARQIRAFCAIERATRRSDSRDFVRWLEGYTGIYIDALRTTYVAQRNEIGVAADVTIDATGAVTTSVERLAATIRAAMGTRS